MRILFLHGWQSVPGGVKPTYLKDHGHEVINPKLPHEDFPEAVRIAQEEFDKHQPDVVVGSSRGGAVAMNINSGVARLVLLCPAWRKYGTARTVKPDTVILHSRADDVVPFADSDELARTSGLDDLIRAYPVDARRIYATGMSNGAIMAYRLASELSGRIAAIAPVAGSVGTDIGQPQRPVSVLHFHGTMDEYIPFIGGRGERSTTGTKHRSVEDSIQAWAKENGCDDAPKIDTLSKDGDEMRVTRKTYGGGQDGAEVVLVVIEGGGHTWPGRRSPANILGRSTLTVSANDLMWDFFQRHPMK